MWKLIDKYNAWYDTVKEPYRAMVLIVKVGVPAALVSWHTAGHPFLWYNYIGTALVALLFIVAARRHTRK